MNEIVAEKGQIGQSLTTPGIPSGPLALFLDLDGTLLEIADSPVSVVVDRELPRLLDALHKRLDGRLAIISGRSLSMIDELLGLPHLPASGSHGLEWRGGDGIVQSVSRPESLDEALCEIEAFAENRPGILVEQKPLGVGLHYRGAPELSDEIQQLTEALASIHRLKIQRGKLVFELRPEGGDKGSALRRFMLDPSFANATPMYFGDDLTDEAAFTAAQDLGGAGVLVGERRCTGARHRLDDVCAVHDWLATLAEALK
ncbi:trehalose-phosphatase [Sphingomonas sp. CJ99]